MNPRIAALIPAALGPWYVERYNRAADSTEARLAEIVPEQGLPAAVVGAVLAVVDSDLPKPPMPVDGEALDSFRWALHRELDREELRAAA